MASSTGCGAVLHKPRALALALTDGGGKTCSRDRAARLMEQREESMFPARSMYMYRSRGGGRGKEGGREWLKFEDGLPTTNNQQPTTWSLK